MFIIIYIIIIRRLSVLIILGKFLQIHPPFQRIPNGMNKNSKVESKYILIIVLSIKHVR